MPTLSMSHSQFSNLNRHRRDTGRNIKGAFSIFALCPASPASVAESFGRARGSQRKFGRVLCRRLGASLMLFAGRGFWGGGRGQGSTRSFMDRHQISSLRSLVYDHSATLASGLKPESSKTWIIGIERKLGQQRSFSASNFFKSLHKLIIACAFCLPDRPPEPEHMRSFYSRCPTNFGFSQHPSRARARGTNTRGCKMFRWLMVTRHSYAT